MDVFSRRLSTGSGAFAEEIRATYGAFAEETKADLWDFINITARLKSQWQGWL